MNIKPISRGNDNSRCFAKICRATSTSTVFSLIPERYAQDGSEIVQTETLHLNTVSNIIRVCIEQMFGTTLLLPLYKPDRVSLKNVIVFFALINY